ncbi:hypothetical protein Agub_g11870, partial [Astrephomene gubernaculifera]
MCEEYVVKRTTMPQYGECEYWDERYSREPAAFDWYQGFAGLYAILRHVFPMDSRLLQVGVGSSRLQEEMVRAGWRYIVNIDYSKVVISHMSELHKGMEQLRYLVADVRNMPQFPDSSFDGVMDKGTLDAILCGERSGQHASAMIRECYRVLKPGASLMLVTYGDPSSRLPYLAEVVGWDVTVYALTKQEVVEAEDAEPVVRPLIKGPYPASNLDCMDALSGLEGMHFVYICQKREVIADEEFLMLQQQGTSAGLEEQRQQQQQGTEGQESQEIQGAQEQLKGQRKQQTAEEQLLLEKLELHKRQGSPTSPPRRQRQADEGEAEQLRELQDQQQHRRDGLLQP